MKTIIITGANGNLGTAVIRLFLERDYKVIATVASEGAKQDVPAHKNIEVDVVDLTDESKTALFVQNVIAAHKKIDAALLLVGGFAMGNIQNTTTGDIKKQVALNFDTAYHVVQPLYEHMLQNNSGRIVFIGARPALQAADGKDLIAYGLSKSLLFKLAEYMNEAAKGKNITATVVVPSTLDTQPNRKSMPDADPEKWVKPEALAEVLEFIVSEKGAPLRETVLKVYNNS